MAGRKVGCATERWQQFKLLTKKNFLLLIRNRTSSVIQIVIPILFIFLLFILQEAQRANGKNNPDTGNVRRSVPIDISTLPRCVIGEGQSECWTFGYTPSDDPTVQAIISTLVAQNGFTTSEYLPFQTESQADAFLLANPNTTQGIFQFYVDYGCTNVLNYPDIRSQDECFAAPHTLSEVVGLKYVVQYNQTRIWFRGRPIDTNLGVYMPMVNAVERAIMETFGNARYDFTISKYAHVDLPEFDVVGTVGPSVIFAAIMFNLVIQTGLIVVEKEMKLRESMRVMGLIDGVYWFSWIVLNVAMNILAALLLIAAGAAFQFALFLKNDFLTYFILLLLFALSMVPLGMALAAVISDSSTATRAGFGVFLVGTLIQSFSPILYDPDSGTAVATVFSLLPFVVFGKGLSDLSFATSNEFKNGLRWSGIKDNDDWSLQRTYIFLIIDFFIWMAIAIYLDNVIYSKRPWYFLVSPSYWRGRPSRQSLEKKIKKQNKKHANSLSNYDVDYVDDDVAAEEAMIIGGNIPESKAVVLDRIVKTYSKKKYLCCGTQSFRAVKDVCVTMDQGQLFCLLGHNGAGKSTTIGMLTGLFPPTSGDAYIFGNSITTDMDTIRESMGVCPQHDVLWAELTAREHLELFAGLKRLYGEERKRDVEARLEDVNLTAAGNIPCGRYSGGMRRRLSVAIALIGDPQIVFLDEPTTGMDPVSRRQVWNLIESVKKGRVTLLTTHSMEEADVLGDKVAIMKGGRLAALGTSLHLKQKFGTGYQVSVVADSDAKVAEQLNNHVFNFFLENAPANDASTTKAESKKNGKSESKESKKVVELDAEDDHKKSKSKSKNKKSKNVVELENQVDEGQSSNDQSKDETESESQLEVKRMLLDGPLSQFQIPSAFSKLLPDFFESLESKKDTFKISNVQIQTTTLEDVFLEVAEKDEVKEKKVLNEEAIRKQKAKRCTKIFWIVWITVFIAAILLAGGLAFGLRSKDHKPETRGRSAEPPTLIPSLPLNRELFPGGVQVSDVLSNQALISCFLNLSAAEISSLPSDALKLHLYEPSSTLTSNKRDSTSSDATDDIYAETQDWSLVAEFDLLAQENQRIQRRIPSLNSDSVYNVFISLNDSIRSEVARFRTATSIISQPRKITFGATSAFGLTFPTFPSLNCAAKLKLDTFLLVGDLIYGQDAVTYEDRVQLFNNMVTSEGFYNLSKSTSFIATWNDQEYKQGWMQNATTGVLPGANQTLQALRATFPFVDGFGAAYSSLLNDPLISPLWRSIVWGPDVEFIVLDTQWERTEDQLISDLQMAFLKERLSNSPSRFKIIVSSIPFTDMRQLLLFYPNSWMSYPTQRNEVIDHIFENRITGVLFVSGGVQFGLDAQAVPIPDAKNAPEWSRFNVTENIVGPVGTFVNPDVRLNPQLAFSDEQIRGIIDTASTTVFELDPGTGEIVTTFYDDNCQKAYTEELFKVYED